MSFPVDPRAWTEQVRKTKWSVIRTTRCLKKATTLFSSNRLPGHRLLWDRHRLLHMMYTIASGISLSFGTFKRTVAGQGSAKSGAKRRETLSTIDLINPNSGTTRKSEWGDQWITWGALGAFGPHQPGWTFVLLICSVGTSFSLPSYPSLYLAQLTERLAPQTDKLAGLFSSRTTAWFAISTW